jgi:hypothetical protein
MRKRKSIPRSEREARRRTQAKKGRESTSRTANPLARILSRLRGRKEPLSTIVQEFGTTVRTVVKNHPEYFQKVRGRWVAAQGADRLPRPMQLLDDKGRRPGVVRGSKAASLLGRYNSALSKFLSGTDRYGGDESLLLPFRGKRVGGVELLTDPEKLFELAQAGELSFGDDLYSAPSGGAE